MRKKAKIDHHAILLNFWPEVAGIWKEIVRTCFFLEKGRVARNAECYVV